MKKIILYTILCFLSISILNAQEEKLTQIPISDDYYGELFIYDINLDLSSGWITIHNKQTGEILVKVDIDQILVQYNENGEPIINNGDYIVYDDFNFDGIKDFAIMDGLNSCYGGTSFRIFLVNKAGKPKYNEWFTALSQDYCGLFEVDYPNKQLHNFSKSGCCEHWDYTFIVQPNDIPRKIKEIETDNTLPCIETKTITTWDKDGNSIKKTEDKLNLDNASILFSFDLTKKKKKVCLIDTGELLYYVFMNNDSIIEYYYPKDTDDDEISQSFVYDNIGDQETLTFNNSSATYQIYNSVDTVGIRVTTGGEVYDMKGDASTKIQNYFFDNLEGIIFENIDFKTGRLDSEIMQLENKYSNNKKR